MRHDHRKGTVVIVSQVYPPDPTSVGQHLADTAAELARRGHRVLVYTADRAYENPRERFVRREMRDGVEVRRLPLSSFGKGSIASRLAGGAILMLQAIWRTAFVRRVEAVLVSTSPPIAGAAGAIISRLHKARFIYWVMDLNPDQAVAMGVARPRSPVVRAFDALNRFVLDRAHRVIALDRFMAKRIEAKVPLGDRLYVTPPWPLENAPPSRDRASNPFRTAHGLDGKFVVMYSGNHSPANPLRTILDVAVALKDDPRIVFAFIGGGAGKKEVEAVGTPNVLSLPYQPLSELHHSLGAADVHVVTMGDDMVGIIHPCKVYGAFAAEKPVIFIGPEECHVTDLLAGANVGWRIRHGDVDGAAILIKALADKAPADLAEQGRRAGQLLEGRLSKSVLCKQVCDLIEQPLVEA